MWRTTLCNARRDALVLVRFYVTLYVLAVNHFQIRTTSHIRFLVAADDTTYDTVFQTTKGDTLILRVHVPLMSSFATFCPAMTLAGVRVRHPWIDLERMRVTGYDPIQSESNWKNSGLLLGAAVHDVVKHLQLNPPEIMEITDQGLKSIQPPNRRSKSPKSHSHPATSNGSNSRSPHRNHGDAPPSYDMFANRTPAPDVPMPTIPASFPLVESMEREELDEKLETEAAFLAFVKILPVFDEIQTISTSKLTENLKIAEENLSKESQLKGLQQEVAQLQQQLQAKVTAFQELESKQNALCAPPDLPQTLKRLNRAKKEAFEKSEKCAEEWVEDGVKSVDDFVKQFVEMRKVHHIRGAKIEILQNSKRAI